MANYVGGDQFIQGGSNNTFNVTKGAVDAAGVDAAVAELRSFIGSLQRVGAVAADGTVTRPDAVVQAVENHGGRLRALAGAVAGGAKDAVLKAVQGGVAALVVALLGGH
jgi:hypothetical protein